MSWKFNISLLSVVFFLTGCVTGTRSVDLVVPDYSAGVSADGMIYIGNIEDKRKFATGSADPSEPSVTGMLAETSKQELSQLIGRQRNSYGKAMGDVALPEGESVQQKTRQLFVAALQSRGYTISDDEDAPIKIDIDIEKFWAWFSPGMWTISFESEVDCQVTIADANGEKAFKIEGYGINKGQVASNENWMLAYQRAFSDFLQKLDSTLDDSGL